MGSSLSVDSPLRSLAGIGVARAELLSKSLGITTCGELLSYYPIRYEDRTRFYKVSEATEGTWCQLLGRLRVVGGHYLRGKYRGKIEFGDDTGVLDLVWFKRPPAYLLARVSSGEQYEVYGRVTRFRGRLQMSHPEVKLYQAHRARTMFPIYEIPQTLREARFSSRSLGRLIQQAIESIAPQIQDTLPLDVRKKYQLPTRSEAYGHIHFPPNAIALARATRRIQFEGLFFMQLIHLVQKGAQKDKVRGPICTSAHLLKRFYEKVLPFSLTEAQKRVMRDIHKDMTSGRSMNRLLQGDVGSGKTVVAWMSVLLALDAGYQVAFLAPTEVLCAQHAFNLQSYAQPMQIVLARLTGATSAGRRNTLLGALKRGEIQVIVGTHALLEPTVQFKNLGLIIIDEQHRFGVAQRLRLWEKSFIDHQRAHLLVTTATPIPRTLAMAHYAELDESILDEKPANRPTIQTLWYPQDKRQQAYARLWTHIEDGQQAYIVCPSIEDNPKLEMRSLMEVYERVQKEKPDRKVNILHGRLGASDKQALMQQFAARDIEVLVSTTVIEVGIDVPNATVMLIESAERFGLAQLHQLRGRIGRGTQASVCLLIAGSRVSQEARTRLDILTSTSDGFVIAEKDLGLRGSGNLLGTEQSGLWRLPLVDLSRSQDAALLREARQCAQQLLKKDPKLIQPEHKAMRLRLKTLYPKSARFAEVS